MNFTVYLKKKKASWKGSNEVMTMLTELERSWINLSFEIVFFGVCTSKNTWRSSSHAVITGYDQSNQERIILIIGITIIGIGILWIKEK